MKNKVSLVGAIPSPMGGVSTYILRCIHFFEGRYYSEVLDPYPSEVKEKILIKHKVPKFKGVYRWLWLALKVSISKNRVIHFNFSTTKSLYFLLLSFKLRRKWVVMLHNGDLQNNGLLSSLLFKLALAKVDKVLYISKSQKLFYSDNGIQNNKLFHLDSYLPPKLNEKSVPVPSEFVSFRDKYNRVIFGNGYRTKLYRLDYLVKFAERNPAIGVVVLLYGATYDAETKELLEKSNQKLENLLMLNSVSPSSFIKLLSCIDIYVRPNSVDSFGLACADSILLGKKVVASDVCERFSGCTLFASGNYSEFEDKVIQSIELIKLEKDKFDISTYIENKKLQYAKAYDL
ncbi:hypothetical protein [Shewanella algae]|uniref:hypothetical protein n=1 Tax=Shewanella algae TaxID=38313 RepID=UPI001AACFC1B|nr:hypothetical protein [Shewanella algae]QTE92138.1 hypothetical protein JKK33_07185 [Shewanella algae]